MREEINLSGLSAVYNIPASKKDLDCEPEVCRDMPDVIVLDGNQRAALAVTRSLGSRELEVHVGETNRTSLASRSKFCARSFDYPDPHVAPRHFVSAIAGRTAGGGPVVLFPMTDVTLCEVLNSRKELSPNVILPFVDRETFARASDKASLVHLALRLGIPVPRTVFPLVAEDECSAIAEAASLSFPIVVKPSRSRILKEGRWAGTSVWYSRDPRALEVAVRASQAEGISVILQERIEGPGVGVFLLMRKGEALARFAHRRIREKPPSGGVSVLCESIEPPPDALDSASRLLGELSWTGVAMVEFKQDRRDGLHKLIEVNARFWGSLQLAVSAGVDFPYLLYRMARGEAVRGPDRYRVGLKSRWELGDLDHLLIRLSKKQSELYLPADAPSRGAVLVRFLADFLGPSVRGEVLRPGDPGPFLFELREYVRHLAGRS